MEGRARDVLLDIARDAMRSAVQGQVSTKPTALPDLPEVYERCAAFVSLRGRGGELRGCVGTTEASEALLDVVARMARSAAVRDPRFPPVRPEEVDNLGLEISVLSPLEPVESLDTVEIGVHGLVVEGRGRRGLLLPQVAEERGWGVDEFVANTTLKAGLPEGAWLLEDVALYRFESEVFGDSTSVGRPRRGRRPLRAGRRRRLERRRNPVSRRCRLRTAAQRANPSSLRRGCRQESASAGLDRRRLC